MNSRHKKEENTISKPVNARLPLDKKTDFGKRMSDDTCGASSMQATVLKKIQKEQTDNYRSMTNFRKQSQHNSEAHNGKEA